MQKAPARKPLFELQQAFNQQACNQQQFKSATD
jgi:hypothetical protein